ncbi:bacteriocin cleavage/export ABC transporter [Paenibacillus sp. CCS19]|nr:bacteriocin cleavage/export ABC transporter [Paenibacillus cellulosilyticus]
MKDCGAACLATVSKQYGLQTSVARIREVAGTDKYGTNAYGMIKAAEQLGFTAKGVKGDKDALFSEFPLPAIAHVIIDQSLLHYVVIHSVTKKKVIIADPAKGLVTYTPEEFFNIWTGVLILLVPAPAFKKGNDTRGLFGRFFHLLLPQRRMLFSIFLTSLLFTLLGILGSFYFKMLLDEIVPYNMERTLTVLSIGIIALTLFKIILAAFRSHLLLQLSQKLDVSLILGYYHHVLSLPMNFFGTRKTGEVLSRLMDASKVRDAISGATLSIMIDSLMVVAGGIILYTQNAFLFGITATLVPLYAIIVWAFNKPFERMNRKQMENNALLTSYLVESVNGIETIKAYTAEQHASFETEKKFIVLLRSIFRLGFWFNVQSSLKGFVQAIGGVIILWVGAVQVLHGHMTLGQLITFNALLAYFLEPIQNLINLQASLQTAIVAADRLGEILELDAEKSAEEDRKMRPQSLRGDIKLQQVDFRYGTRQLTLKDINISIRAGEKIALVGESGSGKTTLVKLLLRFYNAEKGDILINENNIMDIHMDTLRSRSAYISQDTFFFSGTIAENLILGAEDKPPMEQVIDAAKQAKAHEFINQMPLRYDTMLEENASNLSGGQRQRLAIARALLKNPDVLILDEATSNLDTTTERAVSETINALQGITAIIIAHRLSTIMRCDRIFVLEQGAVIESGTHSELLKQGGKYYSLWKDQLSGNASDNVLPAAELVR